jgi:dihydrofolate synthase / folylpolyglutamate synthase
MVAPMSENDYSQCLDEMFGLRRYGIILGLDVVETILDRLGNPHNRFSAIHIAGTNGKGSVAAALAAILQEAGFSVGLYTSPHLVRFNERIRINGRDVSDSDIVEAYKTVREVQAGSREPTFFEYTTAMAFDIFGRAGVDWAVVETGMGGRLDATNILAPKVSVITNISLEHRLYLGNTIAAIAGEKGGIIKPGTPVITGVTQKSAIEALEAIAAAKSAPLYRLGRDFQLRRDRSGGFSYSGITHHWKNMRTCLAGAHQFGNAAITLAACEALMEQQAAVDIAAVRKGLAAVRWPGRLEIINTTPRIIIDGAHNLMAARHLGRFLGQDTNGRKITLVIGILDDKPYGAMLRTLLPHSSRIIVTQPDIDRALPAATLYETIAAMGRIAETMPNVADAVFSAFKETPPDGAICIAGSLYVVGEAIQALEAMGIRTGSDN